MNRKTERLVENSKHIFIELTFMDMEGYRFQYAIDIHTGIWWKYDDDGDRWLKWGFVEDMNRFMKPCIFKHIVFKRPVFDDENNLINLEMME